MILRHLLLCVLLSSSALAQGAPPANPPSHVQNPTQRLIPDELNAEVARRAPAYGGFYLKDGVLYVFVTSPDPVQRASAVRELFALQGEDLRRRGLGPASVVFMPGQFNAAQLLTAKEAARDVPAAQSIDIDETRNRVVVELSIPEMQQQAQAFLDQQHLPPGIVVFRAPPPGKLPEGPAFSAPHRARLEVPTKVAQGDVLNAELKFTNLSPDALILEYGGCAYWIEVLDASTGNVVLPVPGNFVCTSELLQTAIPAGNTVTLASSEWNLRTPAGDLLPAGRYIVRAVFQVGERGDKIIRPADQSFEITAGNPETGTARVRAVLRDGSFGITFQARLEEERGQQVILVTVPDARAQEAVKQLLRTRSLPLDRVRFRTLHQVQVPRGSGDGTAQLEVQRRGGAQSAALGFVLNADLTPWLAQGAWRCQFVTQVIDQRTKEVVGSWPPSDLAGGQRSCTDTGFLWQGFWGGRFSDGRDAPAGTYEIRAGLSVTLHSGRVIWLLAPLQMVSIP